MADFVRKHKLLMASIAAVAGLILCSALWSATASARGEMVARYDISRGHNEVLGYGLPVPWRPEYARLLHERYGVKFRTVALCIVSTTLVAYVDSYNRVSAEAVKRRFGHDVFKECSEEARKKWEDYRKLAKEKG
jgi:hypothetical protein